MVIRYCDKCCKEILGQYSRISISRRGLSFEHMVCQECCDILEDELRATEKKFEEIYERRSVPDGFEF